MNSPSRIRALVLAALMVGSLAALLPPPTLAQGPTDPDVPVAYVSAADSITLHLWRAGSGSCNQPVVPDPQGGEGQGPASCVLRVDEPASHRPASEPSVEVYSMAAELPDEAPAGEASVARFVMDTISASNSPQPDGAQYPFSIKQGAAAIGYTFFYDSEATCQNLPLAGRVGTEVQFSVRFFRTGETDPTNEQGELIAEDIVTACNLPAGTLTDSEGHIISGAASVASTEAFAAGQVLVMEIVATNPDTTTVPNLEWALLFEDGSVDSRVELRSDQAVQHAIWATKKSDTRVRVFDPNAAEADRFMVGRMAIRSPFGASAVPSSGFIAEVLDPADNRVDLKGTTSRVDMVEIQAMRENDASRRVFKFAEIDGEQAWHYPAGVDAGSYTISIKGRILGQVRTLTQPVAMGAFDFSLTLVEGEQANHQLRRSASTTYLLQLTNNANVVDTFQLTTEQTFSTRNERWTTEIGGVDTNGRVTLDPGDTALLQVKLTPPNTAVTGDLARVVTKAVSQASTATEQVQLEGQITTLTVRKVALLILQDPFTIGIDRANEFQVFAWNQGTASDSLVANLVNGSITPNDPDRFRVSLLQTRFDNVPPGAVAPVPVRVVTSDAVEGGQTLDFRVRIVSGAQSGQAAEGTVSTLVEAIRDFELFALDGINLEALASQRYGMWNKSEGDGPSPFYRCESDPLPGARSVEECIKFTNLAYHRFTLTNTGDQSETFRLVKVDPAPRFVNSGGNCAAILSQQLDDTNTTTVGTINLAAPGTESALSQVSLDPGQTRAFYFRVAYDGQEPYDGAGGDCIWEEYRAGVRVGFDDGSGGILQTSTIQTFTRIFNDDTEDLPPAAQARVALDERSVGPDNLFRSLSQIVGIQPGVSEDVPFTLSEQSGHEDTVTVKIGPRNQLTALRDAGWEIRLVEGAGLPVDSIVRISADEIVAPNGSTDLVHAAGLDLPLALRVRPPTTGLQENERIPITVTATSTTRPSVTDQLGVNLQIGEDFAFELVPGTESIEAHAGDVLAFGLQINNTGASRDRYTVTATAPGSFSAPVVQPSTLEVSPGSFKATAIQVTVPDGAAPGTTVPIDVTVTARADPNDLDDDIVQTLTYNVEIVPAGTLGLSADPPVVSIGPSGSATLNFTIQNQAADDRSVQLTEVFAPRGWSTTLSGTGGDVRQVPGGGSTSFTYLIQAPINIVESSRYTFVLRAADVDDPADFANGVGYAQVSGAAAVSVEPEDLTQVIDRGGSATFNVLIRNTGASLSWIQVVPELQSTGWSARVLDQAGVAIDNSTVRVPEKTFKRVQIEVTAPTDVATGHSEPITVRAFPSGQQGLAEDQAVLTALIHDFAIELGIEGVATKDAAPGDDIEYLVTVTNGGNGPDRVRLTFEDAEGASPFWPVSTDLNQDTTPELKPGESLSGVRVRVAVPSPNQGPVPIPEGIQTVIRGTSADAPAAAAPTVTTDITTKLLPYVRFDVDGDGAFEVALDKNRNPADGFEAFVDQDRAMIERGEIAEADSRRSEALYSFEGDQDDRIEHIIDTDGDGIGEVYFDPDKAQTSEIPYTIDADGDSQPEHPIDSDFDGLIDGTYDPATGTVHDALNLDFSGDGRRDLLIDTDDDGDFDTYVDPNVTPHIVTKVTRDGDRYELDTDGDGKVDTFYNVKTQSITDATTTNLQDFLKDYWYFLVLFILVIALFVVIVVRRL